MKKGLLIASIASVTAVTCGLAFAVAHANKGIRFEAAKATDKTITFNNTTNCPYDVATTISSKLAYNATGNQPGSPASTKVYGYTGSSVSTAIVGGDHFLSLSGDHSAVTGPSLFFEIGLNNIKSISITWGGNRDNKDVYALCRFYDEGGDQITYHTLGTADNKTETVSINTSSIPAIGVTKVAEISLEIYTNTTGWGEGSMWINEIALGWSC